MPQLSDPSNQDFDVQSSWPPSPQKWDHFQNASVGAEIHCDSFNVSDGGLDVCADSYQWTPFQSAGDVLEGV